MIYKILVIYNKLMSNDYIQNYLETSTVLIVCDNSDDDSIRYENMKNCKSFDVLYIDMEGNKGLSKAYNKAVSTVSFYENDWFIILDQDTENAKGICSKYMEFIKDKCEAAIICPVIKDSKGILSPSKIDGVHYKHLSTLDQENTDFYSFINSGMCIKGQVFKLIGYDENLFLDMVDHDFVRTVRKLGFKIYLCRDLELYQNFSGVEKNSFSKDKKRFDIFLKDASYFYKKWYPNINIKKVLLKRIIKLTILHRNSYFLKTLFSM